jgi:hypothetical protein
MKIHKKPQAWTDSLDKRPKRMKMDMGFGTRDAISMYSAGSFREVAEEISKYKLDFPGVEEVRWDGDGTESVGEFIFFLWKGE